MSRSEADAPFFLREVAAMLTGAGDANRQVREAGAEAATSKTVAAFMVTGPTVPDARNTREWLLERYRENSPRKGYDFLSSVLRSCTPDSAKDLVYIGAGPGRYVVVTALGRTADKVSSYTFKDPENTLGSGWRMEDLYAAVGLVELKALLDEDAVELDAPLGSRVLAGALRAAGQPAAS